MPGKIDERLDEREVEFPEAQIAKIDGWTGTDTLLFISGLVPK